jgi:acyl-CoA thioester hydrolase
MTNASEITFRVNYSETDRMGVAYYARHAVWLDMARTEFLRERGMRYREVEDMGFRLVVAEMKIRYLKPAEYDDLVLVRCWVEDLGSRRILFAYSIENGESGQVLAKAETAMVFLNTDFAPTRIPEDVMEALTRSPEHSGRLT